MLLCNKMWLMLVGVLLLASSAQAGDPPKDRKRKEVDPWASERAEAGKKFDQSARQGVYFQGGKAVYTHRVPVPTPAELARERAAYQEKDVRAREAWMQGVLDRVRRKMEQQVQDEADKKEGKKRVQLLVPLAPLPGTRVSTPALRPFGTPAAPSATLLGGAPPSLAPAPRRPILTAPPPPPPQAPPFTASPVCLSDSTRGPAARAGVCGFRQAVRQGAAPVGALLTGVAAATTAPATGLVLTGAAAKTGIQRLVPVLLAP